LQLAPPGSKVGEKASTSVSLSDQGLVQVLEAAVTGLDPGKHYLLALSDEPSGTGTLEPLQGFMKTRLAQPSSMRSDQSVRWYAVKAR